ncbi:MAG: helix-turn-helix domain-containing protein, partial [Phycisphaerae bacterium]|nr:helix-turn-helix domain-containing protein [Phycisphaerae bacterium]
MAERLHNTYQVANLLGVTPGTVARWIRNGELQFKRLPDEQVRITEKHLVAFLKKRGIDIEEVMAKAVLREGAESGATVTRGERPALMKPTEQGEPAESGAPTEPQTPSPTPPEPGTETPDPVEELAAEITGKTPAAPEGASQSEDSQPIELTEAPQGEPTAPAA